MNHFWGHGASPKTWSSRDCRLEDWSPFRDEERYKVHGVPKTGKDKAINRIDRMLQASEQQRRPGLAGGHEKDTNNWQRYSSSKDREIRDNTLQTRTNAYTTPKANWGEAKHRPWHGAGLCTSFYVWRLWREEIESFLCVYLGRDCSRGKRPCCRVTHSTHESSQSENQNLNSTTIDIILSSGWIHRVQNALFLSCLGDSEQVDWLKTESN